MNSEVANDVLIQPSPNIPNLVLELLLPLPGSKNELYDKMNIQEDSQLPEISAFDPVAKALMLKPGEVCKIKRHEIISFEKKQD